ncbi:hypothetical protein [Naasia aerilata]|nr:hypothetical protein [Naasia aerilata]
MRTAAKEANRAAAMQIAAGSAWWLFERASFADCLSMVEAARAIPGDCAPEHEATALYACVFVTRLWGDRRAAARYLELMQEAALRSEDPGFHALVRMGAAYQAAVTGDPAEAEKVLAAIDEDVRAVTGWVRHDLLISRAVALRDIGKPARALADLSEAHRMADAAGDSYGVKNAVYVTGMILLSLRRAREAVQVLRIRVVRGLETEDWVSALSAIAVIACACHVLDRNELGAELFAGVDTIGKRFSYAPISEDFFPVYRDRLREALPADKWEAALRRGEQLSFRDLVRQAQSF